MNELINKIHNTDCFDILSKIPDNSIDLVLTDPPYMITELHYDELAKKNKLDLTKWFSEIIRVAKPTAPILVFAGGSFTWKMHGIGSKYFRYEIIWDKVNSITGTLNANSRPLIQHEYILFFSKKFKGSTYNNNVVRGELIYSTTQGRRNTTAATTGLKHGEYKNINNTKHPRSILSYKRRGGIKDIHPNEKPLDLVSYLINTYSNAGNIVLDTFSGSGVTALASIINNRQYIATEIDNTFYTKSKNRISNYLL